MEDKLYLIFEKECKIPNKKTIEKNKIIIMKNKAFLELLKRLESE